MHSLARRACIENALFFQFPRKIRGELKVLIKTAQHQNAQASAFFSSICLMHSLARRACKRIEERLAIDALLAFE